MMKEEKFKLIRIYPEDHDLIFDIASKKENIADIIHSALSLLAQQRKKVH